MGLTTLRQPSIQMAAQSTALQPEIFQRNLTGRLRRGQPGLTDRYFAILFVANSAYIISATARFIIFTRARTSSCYG